MPDDKEKRIGRAFLHFILMELEGFSLRLFTRVLGWSVGELQVLLAGVRQELRDPRYQLSSTMSVLISITVKLDLT